MPHACAHSCTLEIIIVRAQAAFLDNLLSPEVDAGQAVMRQMASRSPAQTSACLVEPAIQGANASFTAQENAAWLAVWQDMDLSHLPGFPMWERGVFEILQPCWPTMRSIFHFYCRRGNHNSALPPHRMGLSAFLLWSEDCRLRTKQFSHARILAIFHYCVLSRVNRAWVSALDFEDGAALVDKVKGGGVLKDDELELLRCFASSETTSPDTEPLSIGFAAFVEGLIRCSFLRANLKWHPGFEDISSMHITPLPGCLQRFLHDCVLRFSHRAGLTFSRRLLGDAHFGEAVAQRQVQLESLCSKLAAVDSLPAFDDPVRLPIAIDNARALFQEGGLLGQTVVRIPRAGSEARVVTSSLNEQQFNDAWNDSRTFVRGCVGPEPSESEQVQGLSQQEFVEASFFCKAIPRVIQGRV